MTGRGSAATLFLLVVLAAASHAQVACGDCNQDAIGPNILDGLVAAQLAAGLTLPTGAAPCACDVDSDGRPTALDALRIAQSAASLAVTLACPASPCVPQGGGSPPTVSVLAPTGGTQTGDIGVNISAGDADGDPLALHFRWSTDGGVSFTNATSTGVGSIPTSPAFGVPVPLAGGTMFWDSLADGVGVAYTQSVDLRVTAWDGTLSASDTVSFQVDNVVRIGPCRVVTCGTTLHGMTGPGSPIQPVTFTPGPAGDSEAIVVDVRGRAPGDYVLLTLENMSSDCDLRAPFSPPGPACGDPVATGFVAWQTGAHGGLDPEHRTFTDVECTGYGDLIPVWIYHRGTAPTATYDLRVDCIPAPCPGHTVDVLLLGHALPIGVAGNTWGADNTEFVGCSGGVAQGEDHVILFRPAMTATYTIELCGTAFDTLLQIEEGSCFGGLVIDCNDDDPSCFQPGRSRLASVPLTAGVDYYIIVDGEQTVGRTYGLWIDSP